MRDPKCYEMMNQNQILQSEVNNRKSASGSSMTLESLSNSLKTSIDAQIDNEKLTNSDLKP